MPRLTVITDTDASLPPLQAEQFGIIQVPIIIQFGEDSLRAVYDISDVEAFARIERERKLPTTSAPSPGAFAEAFQSAFDRGADSVLCFTVSSEVSATYAAAVNAAGMLPGRDITVVDTRSLTVGQGMMVLAAAEAAAAGRSKEEALQAAIDTGERTRVYAALSTLKYLAMSGRMGNLAAGVANLLEVKPVLTIRGGRLEMLERVRTQGKAWNRVVELCVEAAGGGVIERMRVVHVGAPQTAQMLVERLRAALPCPEQVDIVELTPGLSIHSGLGMAGVGFTLQR